MQTKPQGNGNQGANSNPQEKTHGKSTLPRLPHSPEAERALLGGIILGGDGPWLDANEFFLPFHHSLYRALTRLKRDGKPVDDLVLISESLDPSELERCGGIAYIAGLLDGLPKVANLEHYAKIVREKAQLRQIIALGQIAATANGDAGQVLERAKLLSDHIGVEFGQKESSTLFKSAVDLAQESDSAEFLVEPYVVNGAITDLVAKIKAGKTTYALGEIVRQALEKGPVVYLTEQPAASFKVALKRAGLLGAKNLFILPFSAVAGMKWPDIANMAIEQCKRIKAVMLAVDTLPRFCGLEGDSENDSGAALAAMAPLQVVADTGIAVLTLRHERKSGGEIGDAGRGSSAFGGAADTLLTLRRPEGRTRPTIRKIECISRFEGLPAEAIYEYMDGRYVYCGTENDVSEREAKAAILASAPNTEDEAKAEGELFGKEVSRTTARRVIETLVSSGKLTRVGRGKRGDPFRYFLPEKVSDQTTHIYGQKESEPGKELSGGSAHPPVGSVFDAFGDDGKVHL